MSNHSPAFAEPLHVGRPNLGDMQRYHRRLDDALSRRWLTNNSRYVQEFEERIADLCDRRYCIAVSNGTAALEIMLRTIDCRGKVLLPAWTFVATAHACRLANKEPVFADVYARTHTLWSFPRGHLSLQFIAILGVHLWGRPCAIKEHTWIGETAHLDLFYDAAHALGCVHNGKSLAGYGDAAALSFHATKIVNAGEGGAIVTDSPILAARVRELRNFGYDPDGTVVGLGANAKMSELHAALGLTNLESLPEFIAHNRANYEAYARGLAGLPGIYLLPHDTGSNYHYVVLEVREHCPVTRNMLMAALHAENVLARRYFWPGCHRLPPYSYELRPELPVTDQLAKQTLVLPTGTTVSEQDVVTVCQLIEKIIEKGEQGALR